MTNSQINFKFLIVFILFVSLWIFGFVDLRNVYAQNVTLSLFPSTTEILVKPGKSLLIGYTVNNGGDPTPLQVRVRTFSPQGEFGEISIDPELISPIRFSLDNSNMQFETPFLLKPRDVVQALLRIKVPENTPEGDYYFMFLADTQAAPAIGGSTNTLAQATVGSPLLLTVTKTGQVEVRAKIALFSVKPDYLLHLGGKTYPLVESTSAIPVTLIVQNTGRNLVKPDGSISVKGSWGEKKTYALIPQNVLASSSRLIPIQNGNNPDPHTSGLISGNFIGTQTVTADVSFGEGTPQIHAVTSFIAVPLRFMLILFAVLCFSIIIVIFVKKRNK